jgi:hypothetical protein
MAEHAAATEGHGHGVASPISVLWVIAASVIAAAGLFLIAMGLLNFDWVFYVGPFLVFASCLMFLNRRAGLSHA